MTLPGSISCNSGLSGEHVPARQRPLSDEPNGEILHDCQHISTGWTCTAAVASDWYVASCRHGNGPCCARAEGSCLVTAGMAVMLKSCHEGRAELVAFLSQQDYRGLRKCSGSPNLVVCVPVLLQPPHMLVHPALALGPCLRCGGQTLWHTHASVDYNER